MTTAGAGAAAGALTGFVGSSVGAAAVIGGFSAGGAHAVGIRMARRLGANSNTFGVCVATLPEDRNEENFLCRLLLIIKDLQTALRPMHALRLLMREHTLFSCGDTHLLNKRVCSS